VGSLQVVFCSSVTHPAKIQVEFPAFDSGLGHAKRQSVFASLASQSPLAANQAGDLILNRQDDATLPQITQATSTSTIKPRRSTGQQKTRSEFQ
jgi:hypothetical protein